ncbi:xylulokinase [Arcanobacterium ihumii]|uniref:xylulokinase n=1 Tax=Arcanobacterium ihumii TaxID=2138162 RepID=UPI000F5207FA|nr:FGGY-family carbohydrate kinase [Arcanobacterium ihumii]
MHLLSYDIGTSGVKTCLYHLIDNKLVTIGSSLREYDLHIFPDGGAEQDPDQWWEALCESTNELKEDYPDQLSKVEGISFCSQMQSLVLVNHEGKALRPSMSYMDQRAEKQRKEGIAHGIQVSGLNAKKLLLSLKHTGAVAASVKDPVWKYHWVRENEPEIFEKVHRWLDVKEYLIGRMTGQYIMSEDSAFATLLLDVRSPEPRWSTTICKLLNVNMEHLPEIVASTSVVGTLRKQQAQELGLHAGIKVIAGGGDASLIGVGAGATNLHDTHIYWGTSGWVGTVTDKQTVDLTAMVASVVGAQHGFYNYFAELETAGKCFQWVRDHLALDEINIYLNKKPITDDPEAKNASLYAYMTEVIEKSPPGSNGVIFTPWLHGNRCPFEDPHARAMFFNLGIETGKRDMLRAVIEGVCYHLRWFLETQEKKVTTSNTIRFVGGGALSTTTCQILADILGRTIETTGDPQNVGSVGAAIITACGLGKFRTVAEATTLIKPQRRFTPNPDNRAVYQTRYDAFISLYKNNKKTFHKLNGGRR